jgi:hypothetical protein
LKDAKSNLVHFKYADPDKAVSLDTASDQVVSYCTGSENAEPGNAEFDDFEYNGEKSGGGGFRGAGEFYDNPKEIERALPAEVKDDDQSNPGDLEERVMFKRWLNESVKDGPFVAIRA